MELLSYFLGWAKVLNCVVNAWHCYFLLPQSLIQLMYVIDARTFGWSLTFVIFFFKCF